MDTDTTIDVPATESPLLEVGTGNFDSPGRPASEAAQKSLEHEAVMELPSDVPDFPDLDLAVAKVDELGEKLQEELDKSTRDDGEGTGLHDAVAQGGAPMCPEGHTLRRMDAHDEYECDGCNVDLPNGTALFGCLPCDFSLCGGCWVDAGGPLGATKGVIIKGWRSREAERAARRMGLLPRGRQGSRR